MADNEASEKEAKVAEGEMEVAEEALAEEPTEEISGVERLEEALEEASAQADEYLDGWRRTQAEFSNYKKRQRAEQAKVRELANANLLRKLLPVLDDFERAMITMPEGMDRLSWSQGLLLIRRKLEAILETEGVEPIETQGETFDPNYHEAVTHEEMPGYEEGEIIGEVQKGYVLGDRVLRPALVRVAKGAPPVEQEEHEETSGSKEAEE